jgi:hypothetical protein
MGTFWLSNETIGVSGAYARTSGMLDKLIAPRKAVNREYYQKNPPEINWEWVFVVGLILGAFVSSWLSGAFEVKMVPSRWQLAAGDSEIYRWIFAFAGGIAMGFGARWAKGCTSGHGISGTLQLAVSSWIATLSLFAGGIITAFILYKLIL